MQTRSTLKAIAQTLFAFGVASGFAALAAGGCNMVSGLDSLTQAATSDDGGLVSDGSGNVQQVAGEGGVVGGPTTSNCTPDPTFCNTHCGSAKDNCGLARTCGACGANSTCDATSNTCQCAVATDFLLGPLRKRDRQLHASSRLRRMRSGNVQRGRRMRLRSRSGGHDLRREKNAGKRSTTANRRYFAGPAPPRIAQTAVTFAKQAASVAHRTTPRRARASATKTSSTIAARRSAVRRRAARVRFAIAPVAARRTRSRRHARAHATAHRA